MHYLPNVFGVRHFVNGELYYEMSVMVKWFITHCFLFVRFDVIDCCIHLYSFNKISHLELRIGTCHRHSHRAYPSTRWKERQIYVVRKP